MKVRCVSALCLLSCGQTFAQGTTTVSSAVVSETGVANANPESTNTTPIINVNDKVRGPLNATAWSLIYTYPLYIFANFAGTVLRNTTVNQILHQRNLASVDSPGVIKPNVDTTYSRVVLDLSKHDVVLTVPNITDRYWVYPIYDPFGNAIAEIGLVNKNKPGKYLIRRADDVLGPSGLQNASDIPNEVNRNASTNTTQYAGIVNLPTTYGTMLIRLLVRQNTTEDLDIIQKYQNASSLTQIPRNISQAPSPAGNLSSLAPNNTLLNINTPAKLFHFAAKFIQYNEPELSSSRQRVAAILGQAGLYDGAYTPQHSVNLTYAASIANASITADIQNPAHIRDQGNGWQLSSVAYQGNYGMNYAPRAYVAVAGYQQQTAAQTLYPGYNSLGFTSVVDLVPNTALLFGFSGKPQLEEDGFWSLTVYGADQYLIPNELNRAEIGDRSLDLTYQGRGEKVYGDVADVRRDGPFQVLLQPADIRPPGNWSGNWLPVAPQFSFILRWYTPEPSMTNGSYVYPKVETISAITE